MRIQVISKINREVIHFAESQVLISSKYRTVFYQRGHKKKQIILPEKNIIKRIFGLFRLSRRVLRLDKCNVYYLKDNLIIIRQGKVYLYKDQEDELIITLTLRNCRNLLHQSICSNPEGFIYFGEYGLNKERRSVPVFCSKDRGQTWKEIYTFKAGSIKHIHGCYYDKFTDKIWVCTGDFENENWLIVADKSFTNVKKIGDGQQKFRTCSLIFTRSRVHWLMDSQLEQSYHIILDRKTGEIEVGQNLMGPVLYVKELENGTYLAATVQEIGGGGVWEDKENLYYSND